MGQFVLVLVLAAAAVYCIVQIAREDAKAGADPVEHFFED